MLEAQNTLYVPQTTRTKNVVTGNQIATRLRMYYTNCHRTNHNVETWRRKKMEETYYSHCQSYYLSHKPPRPLNYPCHICKIIGHK
jgi:hypothetical protein